MPENYYSEKHGARVYKIRTLRDIFDLPTSEEVQNCLRAVGEAMVKAKVINTALNKEFRIGAKWPDVTEWIDDERHENYPIFSARQAEVKQCLVHGCTNHSNQGLFYGELCSPCYHMLKNGKIGYTDSFLGDIRKATEQLKSKMAFL